MTASTTSECYWSSCQSQNVLWKYRAIGTPSVYIKCRDFTLFNVSQSDTNLTHFLMILAALIVHEGQLWMARGVIAF